MAAFGQIRPRGSSRVIFSVRIARSRSVTQCGLSSGATTVVIANRTARAIVSRASAAQIAASRKSKLLPKQYVTLVMRTFVPATAIATLASAGATLAMPAVLAASSLSRLNLTEGRRWHVSTGRGVIGALVQRRAGHLSKCARGKRRTGVNHLRLRQGRARLPHVAIRDSGPIGPIVRTAMSGSGSELFLMKSLNQPRLVREYGFWKLRIAVTSARNVRPARG